MEYSDEFPQNMVEPQPAVVINVNLPPQEEAQNTIDQANSVDDYVPVPIDNMK